MNKTALVVGASSGVGREAAKQLAADGWQVVAVARGADPLRSLAAEVDGVKAVPGDASDPAFAEGLVKEYRPSAIVLAAGVVPKMGPFHEMSWETFSETWNNDMRLAFHFMRAAMALPLATGSTIVVVSSGAAINGSFLSGGYAGAKRMQWMLAGYAQKLSDEKGLGIRSIAVVPTQLIEGTRTGEVASSTYGATLGKSAKEYRARFEVPLDATKVATAILGAIRGEVASGTTAIGVSGKGIESLA
jgi:NAD(P)-dependent dehydrogenase (short-subunit alcohol dehydrogenase family)